MSYVHFTEEQKQRGSREAGSRRLRHNKREDLSPQALSLI